MKQATFKGKTTRQSRTLSRQDASSGQKAISIAPPDYGIDFVDSDAAMPEPLQTSPTPLLQPKLVVGPANDKYEQEADQVARQVVKEIPSPGSRPIQRQELPEEEEMIQGKFEPIRRQAEEEEELQMKSEQATIQRQDLPEEDELMQGKLLQRRGSDESFQLDDETAGRISQARGGGHPLEGGVQERMVAKMGHDFSRVRVHADSEADSLNRHLQAKAFTTGQDIFFRRGAYDSASDSGRELIAHELSHVVQQSTGRVRRDGSSMTDRPSGQNLNRESDVLMMWPDEMTGIMWGEKSLDDFIIEDAILFAMKAIGIVEKIDKKALAVIGKMEKEGLDLKTLEKQTEVLRVNKEALANRSKNIKTVEKAIKLISFTGRFLRAIEDPIVKLGIELYKYASKTEAWMEVLEISDEAHEARKSAAASLKELSSKIKKKTSFSIMDIAGQSSDWGSWIIAIITGLEASQEVSKAFAGITGAVGIIFVLYSVYSSGKAWKEAEEQLAGLEDFLKKLKKAKGPETIKNITQYAIEKARKKRWRAKMQIASGLSAGAITTAALVLGFTITAAWPGIVLAAITALLGATWFLYKWYRRYKGRKEEAKAIVDTALLDEKTGKQKGAERALKEELDITDDQINNAKNGKTNPNYAGSYNTLIHIVRKNLPKKRKLKAAELTTLLFEGKPTEMGSAAILVQALKLDPIKLMEGTKEKAERKIYEKLSSW